MAVEDADPPGARGPRIKLRPVLSLIAGHGLLKGDRIGVDVSTMAAIADLVGAILCEQCAEAAVQTTRYMTLKSHRAATR